jgi:ketosteroid isomerase-like protein
MFTSMSPHPNEAIGRAWIEAFNAHDVERLLTLYSEDARHTSPKIRALHPETDGHLHGKSALREWWAEALQRLPDLSYALTSVTASDDRVFLEYVRQTKGSPDLPVAEVFDVRAGRIVSSRVYHG